jgi:hypothetical protein
MQPQRPSKQMREQHWAAVSQASNSIRHGGAGSPVQALTVSAATAASLRRIEPDSPMHRNRSERTDDGQPPT